MAKNKNTRNYDEARLKLKLPDEETLLSFFQPLTGGAKLINIVALIEVFVGCCIIRTPLTGANFASEDHQYGPKLVHSILLECEMNDRIQPTNTSINAILIST